jgi:hypothetical protein
MRRPHRLHKVPVERMIISERDFGLDSKYKYRTGTEANSLAMHCFFWFCKLSKIMADIAGFQQRNKFARDWNGETGCDHLAEMQDVIRFDGSLGAWGEEFKAKMFQITRDVSLQSAPAYITVMHIMKK